MRGALLLCSSIVVLVANGIAPSQQLPPPKFSDSTEDIGKEISKLDKRLSLLRESLGKLKRRLDDHTVVAAFPTFKSDPAAVAKILALGLRKESRIQALPELKCVVVRGTLREILEIEAIAEGFEGMNIQNGGSVSSSEEANRLLNALKKSAEKQKETEK